MAQHDMYLDNAKGAAFRADLNNALAALVSNNAGATEPNPAFANMLWYDTSTDQLNIRNEANDSWILLHDVNQAGGGTTLTLDADADTTISSPSDDLITLKVGGEDQVEITDNTLTLTPGSGSYYGEKVITDFSALWATLGLKEFYGLDSNSNLTRYVRTRAIISNSVTDGQEQGGFLINLASGGKDASVSGTGLELYSFNSTVDYPEVRISNRHSNGQVGVVGKINFGANDSAGAYQSYGVIQTDIQDPTAGSDDGYMRFYGLNNGALVEFLRYIGASNVMRTTIPNYETKVTHDDDIPNKKYVDDRAPTPSYYFSRTHGVVTVNNTSPATFNFGIGLANVGGFTWSGGVLTLPVAGVYEIYVSNRCGRWDGGNGDLIELIVQESTGSGWQDIGELRVDTSSTTHSAYISTRSQIKSYSANDKLRCLYKCVWGNGLQIWDAQFIVKRIG